MAENQLARLSGLGRRVEQSGGGTLATIRAEVTAFIAATQATALQARSAAAAAQAAEMAVHAAQAEARRVTGDFVHDFYERKVFDPYLRFATEDDEKAYREREEARRQQIEAARAEGTPEGDLRATNLAISQLEDAGAHGAADSPEFGRTYNGLVRSQRQLEAAIASAPPVSRAEVQPPAAVPDEILAALAAAGVSAPGHAATGHGLNTGKPNTALQALG